jgi:queuine tRNA-ribosyltransferase catalytic subunit
MGAARDAILKGEFPGYLRSFFRTYYGETGYPRWIVDALQSVGVDLLEGIQDPKITNDDGKKWDYAQ